MTDLALLGTELCYWWEAAPEMSTDPDTPAVFRWLVREPDAGPVVEVFVGETPCLSSPAGACGPGPEGDDCCTLHERLSEHRSRGREVLLEVLRFTHFEIGGRKVTPGSLSDRSVRRLLEGLFAFQHAQEGHRVLSACL